MVRRGDVLCGTTTAGTEKGPYFCEFMVLKSWLYFGMEYDGGLNYVLD